MFLKIEYIQNLIKIFNPIILTAKLLSVAATAGWFSPRVFSLILSASFNRLAASLYLF